MNRLPPLALAICLVVVGCAETASSPESSRSTVLPSTTIARTILPQNETTMPDPVEVGDAEEPPIFTEFVSSTACDAAADDANLQVVQAFVNAYNDRDEGRLSELIPSESVTIADMSGIPHLGEDDWTGVSAWAEKGWMVEDRFDLTRLVMYDSGSIFEVERSNEMLRANGIESLRHSAKVHSFRCAISHMVLYLPFENLGASECSFWDVFANALSEGTTQPIDKPEACL